ncbi:MAG: protease inhibitor I42 family protein [Candidatus Bipolaricaulota bacterium]|nr:protease inhibitor I42 family protein [Candidatus Bipolaricaulota bacterium]
MKITRRAAPLLAMAAVLAVALSGCWGGSVTVTVDDAGSIKTAQVGDRVIVRLAGNPTTGFTWARVEPTDEALAASPLDPVAEGSWEFPAGGNMPGAPGLCIFEYRVVHAGTVPLSYAYARSWEEAPAQTFSVVIWARE